MRVCGVVRGAVMVAAALIVVVAGVAPAAAQSGAYRVYVNDNGSFGFVYPAGWDQAVDDDYGTVDLYFDDGGIFIYTPDTVARWGMGAVDPVGFLKLLAPDWGLVSGKVRAFHDSAFVVFEQADNGGEMVESLLMAGALSDGRFVLMEAFAYNHLLAQYLTDILLVRYTMDSFLAGQTRDGVNADDLRVVEALAAEFDLDGDGQGEGMAEQVASGALRDVTLRQYSAGWQAAVIELQNTGVIPPGGALLFREEYAFATGHGNFYAPLARNAPRTDFVLSADLAYTTSAAPERETCALGLRVGWSGDTITASTDVGVTNGGRVFFRDVPAPVGGTSGEVVPDIDLRGGHTFTVVARGDSLTVFVDGDAVFVGEPVTARAGSWALTLAGMGPGARCEARDIWVFALD